MSEQFIWNNLLRVTVGEMTRADHMDYSRDIGEHFEDSAEDFLMFSDDLLVAHAPVRIEVCVDGQWKLVTQELTLDLDMMPLVLKTKLGIEDVRHLPISLFQSWSQAATQANPVIRNLFLSAITNPTPTPSSSAPSSGSVPPSAPKNKNHRQTKTTGSSVTPKT
jgi:hypothetical protein